MVKLGLLKWNFDQVPDSWELLEIFLGRWGWGMGHTWHHSRCFLAWNTWDQKSSWSPNWSNIISLYKFVHLLIMQCALCGPCGLFNQITLYLFFSLWLCHVQTYSAEESPLWVTYENFMKGATKWTLQRGHNDILFGSEWIRPKRQMHFLHDRPSVRHQDKQHDASDLYAKYKCYITGIWECIGGIIRGGGTFSAGLTDQCTPHVSESSQFTGRCLIHLGLDIQSLLVLLI